MYGSLSYLRITLQITNHVQELDILLVICQEHQRIRITRERRKTYSLIFYFVFSNIVFERIFFFSYQIYKIHMRSKGLMKKDIFLFVNTSLYQ